MSTVVLSTGDKILNIMKEMEMGIPGLAALSGIQENTFLNVIAGVCELDITTACRIADALGVGVKELCPDEEQYSIPVRKSTLARIVETINLMKDPLEQMEKFSGHCFRHTFATRCFEAGISPTVQAYMGNATLQMTMDLYTHVTEEFKQSEIEKLESKENKVQYVENMYAI